MDTEKVMTMKEAVAKHVRDGDLVYLAGFSHLIPFAAGHEIIRQKRRGLTLARATPDIIYDQMIAAGCAKKLIFSYAGNPGVGSLRAFRRAVEQGTPAPLEIEEYTHFGMVSRLFAGATHLPFMPLKTNLGSDLPAHNPNLKTIRDPYAGEEIATVPPLQPDVAVIHAQRADAAGNTHIWGILGEQKDAAFAAKRVIVSVEEIVDESVIRSDPNRTIIPDFVVHAVVEEPWAAHPSFAQGYYDRDNDFYVEWDELTKEADKTDQYLQEWIYGVGNRAEYLHKLPSAKLLKLTPKSYYAAPVDYGIVY